jgi:hypothetical protein
MKNTVRKFGVCIITRFLKEGKEINWIDTNILSILILVPAISSQITKQMLSTSIYIFF